MDSSSLSSPSVSHTLHLPFLVLTAHRSDVYELATVLSNRQSVPPAQFAFELVHFPLLASEAEENLSFSDLSGLLKLIASGHFAALFVFPPCSTWSRARHSRLPVRGPSVPDNIGLPSLPPEHQHVPASHNQALEFAVICAEIAQQFCPAVSIIWVAPEDLGGHVQTGPPSVWQFRETTQLQSRTSEVVRGVAYSCELGAADYTRPVGFLTNVPGLIRELRQGWPMFHHQGPVLRYRGPLPQSCACGSKHTSLEGVATKTLPLFQPEFWQFLLFQISARKRSLRDGVQPSPVSGGSLDAQQLYEQSLDCLASVSTRLPQNRVPEARVNNGSDQLFFHFVTWADCCAWSAPWDWSSSINGVKAWSASIIFAYVLLARSFPSLSPSNTQLVFSTLRSAAHGCVAVSSLSAC